MTTKWDTHTSEHLGKMDQLLDLFSDAIGLTADEFFNVKSKLMETGLLPEATPENAAHQIACLVRKKAELLEFRESCALMTQHLSELIHGVEILANWAGLNLFLPIKEIDWDSLDMESLAPTPPQEPEEDKDPPRSNGFGKRL